MNAYEFNIYKVLGDFWTHIWKDQKFLTGLVSGYAAIHRDLDGFEGSLKSHLSRLVSTAERRYNFRHVVVMESDLKPVKLKIGEFTVGSSYFVNGDVSPMRWQTDVSYNNISMITDSLANPSVIYIKNQDFIIEDGSVIFLRNPLLDFTNFTVKITLDGTINKSLNLWFLSAVLDTRSINDIFGRIIHWSTVSSRIYKRILNAVWDLRVQGATVKNVLKLLSALADADVADSNGTVDRVWSEAGRNFILSGSNLYSAPEAFAALKAQGDTILDGDQLFDVVEVYRGDKDIPESSVFGLCIDSSLIDSKYKDGLIFVNKDVPLDYAYVAGSPDVTVLEKAPGVYLVATKGEEEKILTDSELVNTGVVKLPIFEIGGDAAAVTAYRHDMAHKCWELGVDLWTKLTANKQTPYMINPMKFIQDTAFGYNMLFFRYKDPASAVTYIADRCFKLLDETVPAGTSFLLFQGVDAIVEDIGSSNISDSVIVSFLAGEVSDSTAGKLTERIKSSAKQY